MVDEFSHRLLKFEIWSLRGFCNLPFLYLYTNIFLSNFDRDLSRSFSKYPVILSKNTDDVLDANFFAFFLPFFLETSVEALSHRRMRGLGNFVEKPLRETLNLLSTL